MFWNEIKKQFKFFDGVIIISLIILSFLPYAVFAVNHSNQNYKNQETVAIVSINGKEIDRFVLSEETPHQEVTYRPKKKQYNIVEVVGKKIRVKEDNSPDQIAVNTGWISKPGDTSICLPHRLVIEISGVPEDDEDDMIITY